MSKNTVQKRLNWIIKNYYVKGKTRTEAIAGLKKKYPDLTHNTIRTYVYNYLAYLDWKKSAYPANRKKRKKEIINPELLNNLTTNKLPNNTKTDDEFMF